MLTNALPEGPHRAPIVVTPIRLVLPNREQIRAGKLFKIGEPPLTPGLFPRGFHFWRQGLPAWPQWDGGASATPAEPARETCESVRRGPLASADAANGNGNPTRVETPIRGQVLDHEGRAVEIETTAAVPAQSDEEFLAEAAKKLADLGIEWRFDTSKRMLWANTTRWYGLVVPYFVLPCPHDERGKEKLEAFRRMSAAALVILGSNDRCTVLVGLSHEPEVSAKVVQALGLVQSPEDAKRMGELTEAHRGCALAAVFDHSVFAVVTIRQQMSDKVVLTGSGLSKELLERIARSLSACMLAEAEPPGRRPTTSDPTEEGGPERRAADAPVCRTDARRGTSTIVWMRSVNQDSLTCHVGSRSRPLSRGGWRGH